MDSCKHDYNNNKYYEQVLLQQQPARTRTEQWAALSCWLRGATGRPATISYCSGGMDVRRALAKRGQKCGRVVNWAAIVGIQGSVIQGVTDSV